MPKVIDGKRLSAAEHHQWKTVFQNTGKGGIATAAIQKRRARRKRDKARRYNTA